MIATIVMNLRTVPLIALVLASQVFAGVMPSTYSVYEDPTITVADAGEACGHYAKWWSSHYYSPIRRNFEWIGFRSVPSQQIFFDGNTTIDIRCKAQQAECLHYDTVARACTQEGPFQEVYLDVGHGSCPTGTTFSEWTQTCMCPAGQDWEPSVAACKQIRNRNKYQSCRNVAYGHPIHPLTGSKSRSVSITQLGGLEIALNYSTSEALTGGGYFDPRQVMAAPAGAGPLWTLNIQKIYYRGAPNQLYLGNDTWELLSGSANGLPAGFVYGSDVQVASQSNSLAILDRLAGQVYQFSTSQSGASNAVYPLDFIQHIGGARFNYAQTTSGGESSWRSITQLNKLTDSYGRSVSFQYEQPPGYGPVRITSITDSNGAISFTYNDKGMLSRITWPDGAFQEFLYEAGQLDKPWLLTGVRDENQALTASYGYDAEGRALSTQLAGGANGFAVGQWTSPPRATVTRWYDAAAGIIWRETTLENPVQVQLQMPNGTVNSLQTKMVNGMPRITSQTQPAGAGCAASARTQDFDANGNVVWNEDFNGHRTCYANDQNRNVETSRVEGLASGSSCDGLLAVGATLPAGSRKVSTQWHPVWRKAAQVAEPRRLTTSVYNGQPDPFNNGTVASCAPASATLPDGSPIVVLCKQVEQATTDANGAKGLSTTVDSTVASRIQQWTYNQYGQVLTATDPLGNVTTYAYYADTTADHTTGDLNTITNAKSQVTTHTKYNSAGQWLEMKDANSVVTTRTFDLRQRLKTVTTAGITTSYDYWPTGLLKQVTFPDSSTVSYGYDDAHRLTSVTDNLGNSITYTLDNGGNRIGEDVKDPGGKLARNVTRYMDALDRAQQVVGGAK